MTLNYIYVYVIYNICCTLNSFIFSLFIKTRITVCVYFLLFTCICSAQSEVSVMPIDANSTEDPNFLGKHIEYFQEDGRSLSVNAITTQHFTPSENDVLNFGYSTKTTWLRFRIKNTSDTDLEKVVSIQKALQDTVQFFYKDKGQWNILQSGQMISEKEKALSGFSISFPISVKKNYTDTYYIRTVSKYGKSFAVKLLDEPAYYKSEQKELIIVCLLIGILMTIIFYNFFMARSLKDHVYDFYCAAVLGALGVQLLFRGFLKLFVIDNAPFIQEWAPTIIFCSAAIFSSYFCIRFLNTKVYSKPADWALKGIIILNIGVILYPLIRFELFGIYTDNRFLGYSAMLFCVVAIYSGIVVYNNGNKSARFLIFGWSIYFLSIILYSLASLAIIPANTVTMNAYLIGSVLEVFMLSSALADRYKQLKKQRIQLSEKITLKEQEIVHKNDKISSLTVETLKYIKSKQHLTEELKKANTEQEGNTIKEVLTNLQADKIEDKKLEILKQDIDALNIAYTTKLKATYPTLTKGDIELASFVLLGLKRKEIAVLRNTTFDAVKKSMYRLRKKIDINPEESLQKFIISLHDEEKNKDL